MNTTTETASDDHASFLEASVAAENLLKLSETQPQVGWDNSNHLLTNESEGRSDSLEIKTRQLAEGILASKLTKEIDGKLKEYGQHVIEIVEVAEFTYTSAHECARDVAYDLLYKLCISNPRFDSRTRGEQLTSEILDHNPFEGVDYTTWSHEEIFQASSFLHELRDTPSIVPRLRRERAVILEWLRDKDICAPPIFSTSLSERS